MHARVKKQPGVEDREGEGIKMENAKGAEGGIVAGNELAGGRDGEESGKHSEVGGGGRLVEPQECENVLQFRNQACLLVCAKARYRKPLTGGLRTAPASAAKADCGSAG